MELAGEGLAMNVEYSAPRKPDFYDNLDEKQAKELFAQKMADPEVERITVFKNRKERRAEAAEERKGRRRQETQ